MGRLEEEEAAGRERTAGLQESRDRQEELSAQLDTQIKTEAAARKHPITLIFYWQDT